MVREDDTGLQQVMIRNMRQKFGPKGAAVIVGGIALVFVFFGVYTPDQNRGGANGVAGTVNGEPIFESEVQREVQRRMEFFKNLNISAEQLKMLRLEDSIFQDLAGRLLLTQEAERRGMVPSKPEVQSRIEQFPAFQNAGKFDRSRYEAALQNAQLSPAQFEKMIRQEIMGERWQSYVKSMVVVPESELRDEWGVSKDRRSVRYVLITPEMAQKTLEISSAELDKVLKDPQQKALIERRFEAGKAFVYKGKKLAEVERDIAREIVASGKTDAVQKSAQALAQRVAQSLTSDKKSDGAVAAQVKSATGVAATVRDTGMLNRKTPFVPGVGEAKEMMRDVFSGALQKAKVYTVTAGTLIAVQSGVESAPNFPSVKATAALDKSGAKLVEEAQKLRRELESQREREIYGALMKQLQDRAKIVRSKTESS